LDLFGKSFSTRSNLYIVNSNLKVNAATHIKVNGCLYIKDNTTITVDAGAHKNYKRNYLIEYQSIEGEFKDIVFSPYDECLLKKIEYLPTGLTIVYINKCVNEGNVGKVVAGLLITVASLVVSGAGLYLFVRRKKTQERKNQQRR